MIPIGAIKSISTSNLKDDWFSLVVGAQEPDPLVNCIFKTEFFTHLSNALHGQLNLKIGDHIEYNKKPGKLATVKVIKDGSTVDTYKSSTIHTSAGEPPSSVSKPTPRPKQVAARPVTTGKLLRPGGPGGGTSKLASRPVPTRQPLPQSTPQPAAVQPLPAPQAAPAPRVVPQRTPVTGSQPVSQPVAAVAASHARTASSGSMRAPPPPPPSNPPAPKKPTAKVLYDFSSGQSNELSIRAGEIVQIVSKEGNGWWLCMNTATSVQGWTPEAYLEEQVAPAPRPTPPPPPPAAPRASPVPTTNGAATVAAAKAKPAPPAPPAKRPNMAGRKTAPAPPPAPRDSTGKQDDDDEW
ncbi:hypothetical protein EYZ11_000330 [Aspergillus tanneri]|uniref:SH3 domain-containing protein n=1 Tax=Aspergillus tanneri TaxID=1220188 RepID=A0A4S3JX89_9EURO|nr:hypothetical protein EYZ11_000330 [Aspergillus tanneri]